MVYDRDIYDIYDDIGVKSLLGRHAFNVFAVETTVLFGLLWWLAPMFAGRVPAAEFATLNPLLTLLVAAILGVGLMGMTFFSALLPAAGLARLVDVFAKPVERNP